jgi:ubiquinol-cytochrome c reductase cytochrome b subunit
VEDDNKQHYKERYNSEKERGVKFFPDIVYKDMIAAFGVFIVVVGLAIFIGVSAEPPADPNDSTYIPRPEWYFLWLFQLLKYFPGQIEWVGTTVFPAFAVLALLLLPFYDRSPFRYWRKRKFAIVVGGLATLSLIALTIIAVATTPPNEEFEAVSSITQKIISGQDLYGLHCVECHGSEGEGGEITTVEGLEGVVVAPLNAPDFIYTRSDDTIFNVIDYGQQDLGMPPFGIAYGGELSKGEADAIVAFMRYTWDDRVEIPEDAAAAGAIPELGPDEIPVYSIHIEPIVRRTCISCHRPGKKNGEYLMRDYDEILTTGEYTPNLIAGDLGSNLILMLHRDEIEAGGPMPPTKSLREDWIDIWERWVLAGMPENPEDVATPEPTLVDTPETQEDALATPTP